MKNFSARGWQNGFMAVLFLVLLLLFPKQSMAGVAKGLASCAGQIIPALFPFFIVSSLIIHSQLADFLGFALLPITRWGFGIKSPRAATALLISWLGGFAVAASTIGQLYAQGDITKRQAHLLLVSGVGSSIGFVVNTVGVLLLGSAPLGGVLYVSLLCANVCSGLIARLILPQDDTVSASPAPTQPQPQPDDFSFVDAMQSAVKSTLIVCGYVVFFQFFSSALFALVPVGATAQFFINSLLEVTTGCITAQNLGSAWTLFGCCFALSALSLSVFLQVRALLPNWLSLAPLATVRPLHLGFSFLFLRLFVRFLPLEAAQVFNNLNGRVILQTRTGIDTALVLFLLCCVVLCAPTFTSRRQTAIIKKEKRCNHVS